jgi:hypothetical protein
MNLFERLGLMYSIEEKRDGDHLQLKRVKLNKKYSSYPTDILLVSHCYFIIKRVDNVN